MSNPEPGFERTIILGIANAITVIIWICTPVIVFKTVKIFLFIGTLIGWQRRRDKEVDSCTGEPPESSIVDVVEGLGTPLNKDR